MSTVFYQTPVIEAIRTLENGCVVVQCPYCGMEHVHEVKGTVVANCLRGSYSVIQPLPPMKKQA